MKISLCRIAAFALLLASSALAQLSVPSTVPAGQGLTVQGAPSGTLYLFGPDTAIKRKVDGGSVQLASEELRSAGRYVLVVGDSKATFYVVNAKPANISFLARPSRVPAAAPGSVTGSAFVFDQFNNLVQQPVPVKFQLSVAGGPSEGRDVTSQNGVAWIRLDSGRKEGAAEFVATTGGASVKRIVQQVAADPCSIRMRASKAPNGNILVETDPIRDCSGNAVPDGTIVTFTSVDAKGRSTVDARIKRGTAKAELPASPGAQLSVAAGVVMGNEIRWGGGQ